MMSWTINLDVVTLVLGKVWERREGEEMGTWIDSSFLFISVETFFKCGLNKRPYDFK